MIRLPHRDSERIRSALGLAQRPSTEERTQQLLAELAAYKRRRIALGNWEEPSPPANEAEAEERRERARAALAAFAAQAEADRIASGDPWGMT